MLGVVGKVLIELRDDTAVDNIVDGRVRVYEPRGRSATYEGDALGPGEYKAFVVLVVLSAPRFPPRVPLQEPRIVARCYGRTMVEAEELYNAVSDAMHNVTTRVHANGLGIYISQDDSGGTPQKDPDTSQPYYEAVIRLIATTQAVA